jgi:hypothetical protein
MGTSDGIVGNTPVTLIQAGSLSGFVSNETLSVFTNSANTFDRISSTETDIPAGWHLIEIHVNNTGATNIVQMIVDSVAYSVTQFVNAGSDQLLTRVNTIGSYDETAASIWNGDMAEVAVYEAYHDEATRQEIRDYTSATYGL